MDNNEHMDLLDRFSIGQRVGVEKRRGTVKYVGFLKDVDSGRDVWLGVDWDKAEHGKHDGSAKGRRYFQARLPTSGSFIKAISAQTGKGFIESLRERHSDLYNDDNKLNDVIIVVKKSAAEFDQVYKMSSINLLDHYVAFLESDWHDIFPRCSSLNLANNLLDDWAQLFRILDCFPSVQTLDISANIMQPLTQEFTTLRTSVVDLIMNKCRLDAAAIDSILKYFPNLQSLYIVDNGLTEAPSLSHAKHLRSLFIGDNPIHDFTKLWHLGSFPNLQTLNLRGCGIKSIQLPEDHVGFEGLEVLSLNDNPVNDWQSINELGRLPRLKNLRSSGLYASERACQAYEMLTAKLPHLEVIDGSTISPKERKNCELFFLNRFSAHPVLDVHKSDLERLAKIHGEPISSTESAQNTLSNTIPFTLVYRDQRIERKLNLNLSVKKLVTLASRIFGFEASAVRARIQIFEDNYENLKWDASNVLRMFDPEPGCIVEFVPI